MYLSICAIFTIEQFPRFVVFIAIDYYNICQNNQKNCYIYKKVSLTLQLLAHPGRVCTGAKATAVTH